MSLMWTEKEESCPECGTRYIPDFTPGCGVCAAKQALQEEAATEPLVTDEYCEVCGKQGKAAEACTFETCCSCWYGEPCEPELPGGWIEPAREEEQADGPYRLCFKSGARYALSTLDAIRAQRDGAEFVIPDKAKGE